MNAPSTSPSAYQREKALKHSRPASLSTGTHSVLSSLSTAEYDRLATLTYERGFLEVEPNGTRSLVYQTGEAIGVRHIGFVLQDSLDSFRLVLSTSCTLAHGRPVASQDYAAERCASCGQPLVR